MSKVLVSFIQDRSGSMISVWEETLSGFRSFVNDLRDKSTGTDVEYLFSLTTFDTQVETPIVAMPIADVDVDALKAHGPRGATALYDAVGITIKNTEDSPHGVEKFIAVIVTDGQENSSREWSKDNLHKAIDMKLSAGNWTFTYLGTQPETWDDASRIGVGAGASATYQPHRADQAYAATAGAVHRLAASPMMGSSTLLKSFMPDDEAVAAGIDKDSPGQVPAPPPSKLAASKPKSRFAGIWR